MRQKTGKAGDSTILVSINQHHKAKERIPSK
jgi:hypothetical protein